MSSDFNCEDLLEQIPLASFQFRLLGQEREGSILLARVEMVPATDRLKRELGISKSIGWVRQDIGMIIRAEYFDERGSVFKRFIADDIRRVRGIWTAHRLVMESLRAQHSSEVKVVAEDYLTPIADSVFSPEAIGADFDLVVGTDPK